MHGCAWTQCISKPKSTRMTSSSITSNSFGITSYNVLSALFLSPQPSFYPLLSHCDSSTLLSTISYFKKLIHSTVTL